MFLYCVMSCSALATTRQEQKSRTTNQGAASAVTDKLVAKTEQAFTVYTFRNQTLGGIFRRPSALFGSAQAVRKSKGRGCSTGRY